MHYKENKANEQKWGIYEFFVKSFDMLVSPQCYLQTLYHIIQHISSNLFVKIYLRYKKLPLDQNSRVRFLLLVYQSLRFHYHLLGSFCCHLPMLLHHRYHLPPRCSCHFFRHHRILHCHYASLACIPKKMKILYTMHA